MTGGPERPEPLRRGDREIVGDAAVEAVIRRCACCRLGFRDGDQVYIVPLSFGYQREGGRHTFYFHGARQGRKLRLIRESPRVGFELDTGGALIPGRDPCSVSMAYESVVGTGGVRLLESPEEKRRGLEEILRRYGQAEAPLPEEALEKVSVFRLDVEELRCKARR